MREQIPAMRESLDEWTARMMSWHFSEETGSPFWLARRSRLPFDPIRDVTDYASLRLFGLFDKTDLRGVSARDLVPRGFAGRPFRVVETGGTSGLPYRVVDVTRAVYDVKMYRVMLEARGLLGGDILAMTPSGPHAYGHFVKLLGDSWGAAVFSVDFDPRWVKHLLRASSGDGADAYVEHLVAQTADLLRDERVSLLFTTAKLLLSLAPALDKPLAEYGVRAVCTGGTSCSPEEARYLREEYLDGVQWIDTYGNTLVGHALQGDAPSPGEPHSYHLPPPFAVMHVVRPDDVWQEAATGERGRIRAVTLLEDLFLPNLLERDSAVSAPPHPWFPWPGVARVGPYEAEDADQITEGVY